MRNEEILAQMREHKAAGYGQYWMSPSETRAVDDDREFWAPKLGKRVMRRVMMARHEGRSVRLTRAEADQVL